ncbi:tRNA (adenosine(37)-N6)-dimethylallyltransferase MiaA [Microbacter margulisiae]|uniref:tRNA dimethylallyltransferase n=1 Tax=Microbacter margulisiae TaxID=1350067 RepID=A0A7W5H159_9PORP|nr:tRNA (adenosine(37)-N6)-dimethylallyltransferase MiaA [Microbacter margulisiae]MBB3186365.1 tRNA dimethylallyltransferase [Microbacter margulisiae]
MHTLLVLLGPTGIGKTELSLHLAKYYNAPILSSDSRQFYRELNIGTAKPTPEQLLRASHYFINTHSILDNYNAGQYEIDVINILPDLFANSNYAMLVGGSMLYIEAVCHGIDDLPTIDPEIRQYIKQIYLENGVEGIRSLLKKLDVTYYNQVDLKNSQRIMHALEICIMTNQPYSALRTQTNKTRPFQIIKIGLNRPREELYERINKRVDEMISQGLETEVRSLYPYKQRNPLNTVGYKEFFDYFDGHYTYTEAIDKIKQHSRNYAKKQLSWFNRDASVRWFHPDDALAIINYINSFNGNIGDIKQTGE